MARTIDVDALKHDWNMANDCNDCPRDARACQLGMVLTRMDVCKMLDEAPTVEMPGWVSIQDRLPKLSGFYLVFRLNDGMYVEYFAQHTSTWFMEDADEDYGVAYWMLLPEEPKEEKVNG